MTVFSFVLIALAVTMILPHVSSTILNADCYSSSRAILRDMKKNRRNGDTGAEYILCPNTVFNVGNIISPLFLRTFFQHPLLLYGKNNIIKCGESGSRENNCIFQSKNAFSVILAPASLPQYGIRDNDISGTVLQGLTVRGDFGIPLRLLGRLVNFNSAAVVFAAPGDVFVDDCVFVDMSLDLLYSPTSLDSIGLGTGNFMPNNSSAVTFQNSYFKNIATYGRLVLPAIYARSQVLIFKNNIFEDISLVGQSSLWSMIRNSDDYPVSLTVEDSCFVNVNSYRGVVQKYAYNGEFDSLSELTYRNNYRENVIVRDAGEGFPACEGGYFIREESDPNQDIFSCENMFDELSACSSTASTVVPSVDEVWR